MTTEKLTFEVNAELVKENERLKTELANHIAVNSLLVDSDGEADLANKLFNLQTDYSKVKTELAEVKRFLQELNYRGNLSGVWKQRIERFVK